MWATVRRSGWRDASRGHDRRHATSAEYIYAVRQKGEIPPKGRFAVLFIDLAELQQLFHRPGEITDVSVLLAPRPNVTPSRRRSKTC